MGRPYLLCGYLESFVYFACEERWSDGFRKGIFIAFILLHYKVLPQLECSGCALPSVQRAPGSPQRRTLRPPFMPQSTHSCLQKGFQPCAAVPAFLFIPHQPCSLTAGSQHDCTPTGFSCPPSSPSSTQDLLVGQGITRSLCHLWHPRIRALQPMLAPNYVCSVLVLRETQAVMTASSKPKMSSSRKFLSKTESCCENLMNLCESGWFVWERSCLATQSFTAPNRGSSLSAHAWVCAAAPHQQDL